MDKQLFNRNDEAVKKAALESDTVEDFVALYKDSTTATEKTLASAYYDIKYNSKIATVRAKSGSTKSEEPIEPIAPIKKPNSEKSKHKNVTTTTTVKVFEAGEKEDGSDDKRYEIVVDKQEETTTTTKKDVTKTVKATTTTTEAPKSGTKTERIASLLREGKTNKEIKLIYEAEGDKVYDSQILAAKKKI